MAKSQFLMMAYVYNKHKDGVGGYLWSEKIDGRRVFWDGGITRGMFKDDVPWANLDKDGRYVDRQIATGLWSRYGNVIHAPDWFLDKLPKMLLDGELWIGRGDGLRQELNSIITNQSGMSDWRPVHYHVFGSPPISQVFKDRVVDVTNYYKWFKGFVPWVESRAGDFVYKAPHTSRWEANYEMIGKFVYKPVEWTDTGRPVVVRHPQHRLPYSTRKCIEFIEDKVARITDEGGEGMVLRHPNSLWIPERSHDMLKVKKLSDMEGRVIGYTTGRRTDKGSKLLGMMGALILQIETKKGKRVRLEISGFTEAERNIGVREGFDENKIEDVVGWACDHPGEELPDFFEACEFPRGTKVTFRYRGLSKDGIPQEARYWRKRN